MRIEPAVDAARRRLGIPVGAVLGAGGEAVVYALDAEQVARIHRPGARRPSIDARADLLAELVPQRGRVPFALPSVLETRVLEACVVCIEPRLPGEALLAMLARERGARRESLVRGYLDAAAAIGALDVARTGCRDLCRPDAVHAPGPRAWARARLTGSLAAADASASDREIAREWLHEQGLDHAYGAAERFAAAFWSPAADDRTLHAWCRRILLGESEPPRSGP